MRATNVLLLCSQQRPPINALTIAVLLPAILLGGRTTMATEIEADHSRHHSGRSLPNIVIIYADDLGYGDVQCYNRERGRIPTPHIDSLASQGMRFTDGHSSSGVCSPSRYTLLTGRYHWRTRLQSGIVNLWGKPLIANDRMTIASLAKQRDYQTACIGKWHLGWNWPIPEGKRAQFSKQPNKGESIGEEQQRLWNLVFSQSIPGGPTACGFDEYFGTDVPNWPPFCFIENDRTVGIPSQFLDQRWMGNNQASKQGPALDGWTLEPILPAIAKRAIKFIEKASQSDQPYLLYLPLTSPHTPLAVNDPWKGKSGLNRYADLVMETDAVVGRVLESIKNSDEEDQTLVVFTSDNGCAPYIGVPDLEKQGHYPSGPLRGYKADAWEGGHRVPFIVRWPDVVDAGSTSQQLVHQADMLATLAEILEIELADDEGEDSFSLMPLFRGDHVSVRETSVSCSVRGVPSIRVGTWKYIAAPGSGGWGKGGDQSQPLQLYDLSQDLAESHNLAKLHPERLASLQRQLESIIANGRSTPSSRQANDVRVKRYPPQ